MTCLLTTYQPIALGRASKRNPSMSENQRQTVLYTQSGCVESAKVRSWLTDRGISFTERDASTDPDAAAALVAAGTFATPLLMVGEKKVLGFRPDALFTALDGNPDSDP